MKRCKHCFKVIRKQTNKGDFCKSGCSAGYSKDKLSDLIMKIFIGEYKIYDGEHEHYKQLMVRATTQESANEIFQNQEHDNTFKDATEELTWFDYGDGSTIAEFRGSEEIAEAEALILEKHDAVHFFTDFSELGEK